MMLRWLFLSIALLLTLPASATAIAQQPNTRIELLSETRTPRAGASFTIALAMTPRKGWHTYWVNPGDAGMETRARWTLPQGFTVSDLRYPVPTTYVVGGIMNHVFEGEAVLLADVKVPAGASGAFVLQGTIDWLVCDDSVCVPESAILSLPLTVGEGVADKAVAGRFADARAALPRAIAEPAQFAVTAGRFRLMAPVPADGIARAHFFPLAYDAIDHSAPQTPRVADGRLIIETAASPNGKPERVPGVLRIERKDGSVLGLSLEAVPGAVPPGEPLGPPSAAGTPALTGFGAAFGLALLGGLLLNLMPCVFPILSLKAMSLARAGTSSDTARVEGLAYTAGVILSCMTLGGIAIALVRAGAGAGWAFQLQDPRVILVLLLLVLAIGLNFAGLFDVEAKVGAGQSLAGKPGPVGAFFTGTLAALVATPCTGPFMAGALGAALVLPPLMGLMVFAGLGLGLALPFLLVGFVPALRRLLPRPGPWMLTFRRVLAVPMLLTAVALAWVLGRQAGVNGLAFGLLVALLLALGLWWMGLRQGRMAGTGAPLLVALLAAIAGPILLPRLATGEAAATPAVAAAGLEGVAFSSEALAEARAAGPVFLYFTADWCITCKVNEKGALSSPAVAEALKAADATVMVGDWTRPDPAIAQFLEARGRAGIPLYLFYGPDGEPIELPQILTVDAVVDTVRKSSGS
jgi:thiol:disulfide interchange protein